MPVCSECGARIPGGPGPVHAYVPAPPGCWATFTALQAEQLMRWGAARAHGTVVDAYMAQHPGDGTGDPRARRSPIIHLVGLCGRLEHGLDDHRVGPVLQRVARRLRQDDPPALVPRTDPGAITVADMSAALDRSIDPDGYATLARTWAEAVWATWDHEHPRIRRLYRDASEG